MISPPAGYVETALLGAALGLDVVSFPQGMLSRPLVAATLAGVLAGNTLSGMLLGAALEFMALETLPIGASRYPEWGSAAVVGGTMYAMAEGTESALALGAMCVAVLIGVGTAWVGGRSMVLLRQINGRFARRHIEDLAQGSPRTVVTLQLSGILADLLRGFILTLVALLIALPAQAAALAHWETSARESRAIVVALAATVAAGAMWQLVHGVPRARWLFLAGLLCGLVAMAIT